MNQEAWSAKRYQPVLDEDVNCQELNHYVGPRTSRKMLEQLPLEQVGMMFFRNLPIGRRIVSNCWCEINQMVIMGCRLYLWVWTFWKFLLLYSVFHQIILVIGGPSQQNACASLHNRLWKAWKVKVNLEPSLSLHSSPNSSWIFLQRHPGTPVFVKLTLKNEGLVFLLLRKYIHAVQIE